MGDASTDSPLMLIIPSNDDNLCRLVYVKVKITPISNQLIILFKYHITIETLIFHFLDIYLSTQSVRESIKTTQISLWFPFKNRKKNFNNYSLHWNLIRSSHHHHQHQHHTPISSFFRLLCLQWDTMCVPVHHPQTISTMDVCFLHCYYHRRVNYLNSFIHIGKNRINSTDSNRTHLTNSRWKLNAALFNRIFCCCFRSLICLFCCALSTRHKQRDQTLFQKRFTAIKLIERQRQKT